MRGLRVLPSKLRRLRSLRVLAVAFLVPVVVLANPTTAAADTGWTRLDFAVGTLPVDSDSVPGSVDSIDCSFNMANQGGYSLSIGAGYCYGLPDVSWGFAQDGESGSSYRIDVSGQAPTGVTCSGSMTSTFAQHPKNGTLRVAGTITPGDMSYDEEDCTILEVCLTLRSGAKDCVSASIEPPEVEETTSACKYGTPRLTNLRVEESDRSQYVVRYNLFADLSIAGELPPGITWTYAPRFLKNGTWSAASAFTVNRFTGQTKVLLRFENMGTDQPTPPVTHWGELGVEISAPIEDPPGSGVQWNPPGDVRATKFPYSGQPMPVQRAGDYSGWTDPTHCRFWLGPKVLDIPGYDGDEPSAPIGQAPVTDPELPADPGVEDPNDPVVDPPSEGNDWLSMIWAVLKSIWGTLTQGFNAVVAAVKGIVSSIVDGILGGLSAVFVPGDGFFDRKVNALDDSMRGTTVGNYTKVLDRIYAPSATGCEGPSVTLPFGGGGSHQPLDSCDGAMSYAASISRTVIAVGFGVTAFFAVVRILGSGFGWNPTPSGGVQ